MKRGAIVLTVLILLGLNVGTADAGVLQRLWQLEQRKNAWLKRTFLERDWRRPRLFRRG